MQRHYTIAPTGQPKVLLYSHDTFGLGHLRRNMAIAAHLLQRRQSFSALLLTGSPVAESWPMPAGLQVRALPSVVKTGVEEYQARDRSLTLGMVKARREAAILDAIVRYRPDVFLVDHAPAGMKGELLDALEFIRRKMPATRIILGLRDIIDSSEVVRSLWRSQSIYQLLDTMYDRILVYGSRHLFDVTREYDFPPAVAAKTEYCGYIARTGNRSPSTSHFPFGTRAVGKPVVLVTAGGGGDGYHLLSNYLRALDRVSPDLALSVIVPGPLMAEGERRALEEMAARRADVRMVLFTTDLAGLIQSADLVVSMAGYNTTAEILVAKKASILVPRGAPRMEQRLRAMLLARLGLAWAVQPEEDLVTRLTELVQGALSGAQLPRHDWSAVDLGGVRRVGGALDDLLGIAQCEVRVAV